MDKASPSPSGETIEGNRAQHDPLLRCRVVDAHGEDIGAVETAWLDRATGTVEFIGVLPHWLTLKVVPDWLTLRVVPVPVTQEELRVDTGVIRLPYTIDLIKRGPRLVAHGTLNDEDKSAIYGHFKHPRRRVPIRRPRGS